MIVIVFILLFASMHARPVDLDGLKQHLESEASGINIDNRFLPHTLMGIRIITVHIKVYMMGGTAL
jgi:hypothetical protein